HPSPFLTPPPSAQAGTLALLHLRRDHILPLHLSPSPTALANTRFGSFPHSTLIGVPWGSQVLSYNVKNAPGDRGSGVSRKRKRGEGEGNQAQGAQVAGDAENGDGEGEQREKKMEISIAGTGFAHLLPPTPELWTQSLPHRTQVVYTPDYSFVLSRLRVRPGSTIIEAGAGSGSFTHASARAVFNGYENGRKEEGSTGEDRRGKGRKGRVFSFEFHEPRKEKLQEEIDAHGLGGLVTLTHRDVCEEGFCLGTATDPTTSNNNLDTAPNADAIFLDLPAPWLALKHLSRRHPTPLNPTQSVRLCTFSPCMEQVTKTINTLRELGWVEITMVEVMHKRLDVRRERVGVAEENLRGGIGVPKDVSEAVRRLREVTREREEAQAKQIANSRRRREGGGGGEGKGRKGKGGGEEHMTSRMHRREKMLREAESRKLYREGRLVHRTEPDWKTHTSYLVFAVLPREWTVEDEERYLVKW
ncbi:tRNA methyltransferase complex GCD14 subunit, partial [Eremomyces bilateralis CBS 781.70]